MSSLFEAIFKQRTGRTFSLATEEDWKCKSNGIASFKSPTMQCGTLRNEDVLCEGYRPKSCFMPWTSCSICMTR